MKRKDILFSVFIFILLVVLLWQVLSKSILIGQLKQDSAQISQLQKYNDQLSLLSGIGPLKSAHIHADVKIYINGKSIDFSQKKYQITTSYIHFEDGVGDVVHMHATGMTISHLLKSVGMDFKNGCLIAESTNYCSDGKNTLKFYVNGKENDEFGDYVMKDLDRILISYGSESGAEIQEQLDLVTGLAKKYSTKS